MGRTGHEKDYGNDPAKRVVRRKLKEFIEATFSRNSYGGLTVLCLPGVDLWEIVEVYSAFPGLQEKNLTVVERNKLNAQLIRAALPNALCYPGELLDFLRTTTKRWDVISLDFCSNYTAHIDEILRTIRQRELLSDRGVLFVEILGARETKQTKEVLQRHLSGAFFHDTPGNSAYAEITGQDVPPDLTETNLAKIRSDIISHAIITRMLDGPQDIYWKWVRDHGNEALKDRIAALAFRLHLYMVVGATIQRASRTRDAILGADDPPPASEAELLLSDDHAARSLKGHATVYGRRIEQSRSRFGISLDLPSFVVTPEIEQGLEALISNRLTFTDDGTFVFNTAERRWTFPKRTHDIWRSLFWQLVEHGSATIPDRYKGEIIQFPALIAQLGKSAHHLFKEALLDIFRADLNNVIIHTPFGAIDFHRNEGGLLFEYTMSGPAKVYWIAAHERFRYRSDSNSPMLADAVRVNRCFEYRIVVDVGPEGRIRPYIPDRVRRSHKAVRKWLRDNLEDFQRWKEAVVEPAHKVNAGESFPDRQEITGEDEMRCSNCDRLEQELALLKRQLKEMKEIVTSCTPKRIRKAERRISSLGIYDRKKIAQMLRDKVPNESIIEELGVGKWQIAGIKAYASHLGSYDAYIAKLDQEIAESDAKQGCLR